jgi:tRNA pseudouridine55 synthase
MTRRKKGNPVHGWLVLDKPVGMTSTQAVGAVRRAFSAQKAGHAGTLDPLATGILPIALGEATKTVPFVQDGGKRYAFDLQWGAATTTDDTEGEILATSDVRPTDDLARAGEAVELAPRPVTIDALTLVAHGPDRSSLEMACEKGTYVRSLARDLAEALGTRGHVSRLRRTAVGPFDEASSLTIATIEAATDRDALLRPTAIALAHIPELRMSPDDAATIRNGGPVLLRGGDAPIALPQAWASLNGAALAIGQVEAGHFKPGRVLRA